MKIKTGDIVQILAPQNSGKGHIPCAYHMNKGIVLEVSSHYEDFPFTVRFRKNTKPMRECRFSKDEILPFENRREKERRDQA